MLDQKQKIVAPASDNLSAQIRLPANASISTAELQPLKMAFNVVTIFDEDCFNLYTDSLSSLHTLHGKNCDHPFIYKIDESFEQLFVGE